LVNYDLDFTDQTVIFLIYVFYFHYSFGECTFQKNFQNQTPNFLLIIVLIHPQPARQTKKTAQMAVDTCYEVG